MSEENKNLPNEEAAENMSAPKKKISKKAKAAIIAVAAVAVAAIVILIGFGIGGDADRKGTGEETAYGETTTLLPGIENGVVVNPDDQNNASGGASSGGSGSGGSSQNGNSSGSGAGTQGGSENQPPEETTTVPDNRYITVYVVMPENSRTTDTLEAFVNGESIGTIDVNVDGNAFQFTTPEKYEGDVTVEVKLQNYGTSVSGTAYEGTDSVELRLPLNRAEENLGNDF